MSNLAEKIEFEESNQPPTETALTVYRQILTLTISNQETLGQMADLVKQMKTGITGIKEWFKPLKDSAHKAHKDICTRETETLATFVEAETAGQKAINAYLNEEKKRSDAEALRLQQEASAAKKKEQEELQKAAEALEKSGSTTAAAALRQEAERVIEAPVFVDTVDRTVRTGGGAAGGGTTLSAQTETVVQVTNVKLFLKYLVEKDSAAVFIEFPVSKLKQWVKSQGLKNGDVPGLAIEERLKSTIR